VFNFKFRLDKRRAKDKTDPKAPDLFPIKVNLHNKSTNTNRDFTIPPATANDGSYFEFDCSESDFEDAWTNKDKKDSFNQIIGETTVYGRKLELRTLLKTRHDHLTEIIGSGKYSDYKQIKEAFKNYKPKSKNWNDVKTGLKNLYEYHFEKRQSFEYAQGFIITLNNLERYTGSSPLTLKFTDITLPWCHEYEQVRKASGVSNSAVRKDLVNLRTAYNVSARDNGQLKLNTPWGKNNGGYSMPTGSAKNAKLTLEELGKLVDFKSDNWYYQNCRDFFLVSFYLRGANLTDIARLEKGQTVYTRKKTKDTSGAKINVPEFKDDLKEIIERHKGKGKYIFNIIQESDSELEKYKKIKSKTTQLRDQCPAVAKLLGINEKFTFQWARHTVAYKLATSSTVPSVALKEMFGHTSFKTTEGYIATVKDEFEKEIDQVLDIKIDKK